MASLPCLKSWATPALTQPGHSGVVSWFPTPFMHVLASGCQHSVSSTCSIFTPRKIAWSLPLLSESSGVTLPQNTHSCPLWLAFLLYFSTVYYMTHIYTPVYAHILSLSYTNIRHLSNMHFFPSQEVHHLTWTRISVLLRGLVPST